MLEYTVKILGAVVGAGAGGVRGGAATEMFDKPEA
jgi:hypothetical protein